VSLSWSATWYRPDGGYARTLDLTWRRNRAAAGLDGSEKGRHRLADGFESRGMDAEIRPLSC
jgi:hypothetical protein